MRIVPLAVLSLVLSACASAPQGQAEADKEERTHQAAPEESQVITVASSSEALATDALFAQYAKNLPAPKTLSEQNGATCECANHGGATYSLLHAASEAIPAISDTDLLTILKWARHEDPCIRQIAMNVLVTRLGYGRDGLSIPNMHQPTHHQFHAIHAVLKGRLDSKNISYDKAVFGELVFKNEPAEVVDFLIGKWSEKVDANSGRQFPLEVTSESSRLTSRRLPVDARFPDTFHVAPLKDLTLSDGHFVAVADPTQQFWPVSENITWYRALSPYWVKLHRTARE